MKVGALGAPILVYMKALFNQVFTCLPSKLLLGAPSGVQAASSHVSARWPDRTVSIHLAALDEKVNDVGYIMPGLGGAVGRLCGSVESIQ